MSKVNLRELEARSEYINCQKHPIFDLYVWNYNNRCQYKRAWDEYTRMARGLITDKEGNIKARSFPKFFNIGETESTKVENLPDEVPMITKKYDGSLGISYLGEDDKTYISTRGSFVSEQAEMASKWAQGFQLQVGWTYLFEIIYPENRIVVDYGDKSGLVLLTIINIETGKEKEYQRVVKEAESLGIDHAEEVNSSLKEVLDKLPALTYNEEGFVARYSSGLRVKMKGKEYMRLHRAISALSNVSVWECLSHNVGMFNMIQGLPKEMAQWVIDCKVNLQQQYSLLAKKAEECHSKVAGLPTRKDAAALILKEYRDIAPVVFAMLDGKDTNYYLWKLVKPALRRTYMEEQR